LNSTLWLDDKGEVLREESSLAGVPFVSVRQEKSALDEMGRIEESPDLLVSSRVVVDREILYPRRVKRLRFKIIPVGLDKIPTHGLEIISSFGKAVEAWSSAEPKAETLSTEQTEEYLTSTLSMPTGDEKIIATSRRLTNGSDGTRANARSLATWVCRSMKKEPTLSFPNAADVIRNLRGDCNEHAVLYGALARAAGIPTKVCAGLIYLDGFFYYHAWNEVYLDGYWHSVDTTLPQKSEDLSFVDGTHIKLAEGELEQQVALLSLIGHLQIDILGWEHEREVPR